MNFYHVVVTVNNQTKPLCIFKDLSKNNLNKYFIKPYKLNHDIYYDGSILSVSEIKNIKIIVTENIHKHELQILQKKSFERIEKHNNDPESILTIISAGSGRYDYEIEKSGTNVTNSFINKGPGEGTFLSKFFGTLKHPWVVSILGVALTLILIYFGIK